jgi:hypothetical protein
VSGQDQTELERAVSLISAAYANGHISALELAAEMDRIGKIARDACGQVDGFGPAPERIAGELEARIADGKDQILYHNAFLDDLLRGISKHDLVLVGAETGAGKTDLVTGFARESARRGKRVKYFALEAEPMEIERRIKFSMLGEFVDRHGSGSRGDLNYPDWRLGLCEHVVGKFNIEVDEIFSKKLSTLHTYYRGSNFGNEDLRRLFLAVAADADLVIVDHLHYVEVSDEDENRGYKRTVTMIRDLVLGAGVPCILVAHLRKRDRNVRRIVPDIEDFHGSSDVIKVCTRAILLAPARAMPSSNPMTANTFVTVAKDRIGGATGLVALHEYHRGLRSYSSRYRLGRQKGDEWEELPANERPRWAKRCA